MEKDAAPNLPSSQSAYELLTDKPGAEFKIARDVIARAILIRTGMQAANLIGQKVPDNALFLSLLGSLAIEAFVVGYTAIQLPQKQNEKVINP